MFERTCVRWRRSCAGLSCRAAGSGPSRSSRSVRCRCRGLAGLMPRDRPPVCRRDLWRCSWLTLLVEAGEALPRRAGIHAQRGEELGCRVGAGQVEQGPEHDPGAGPAVLAGSWMPVKMALAAGVSRSRTGQDRKSTRLNSSHSSISYAVFCLKKKKKKIKKEITITNNIIKQKHK